MARRLRDALLELRAVGLLVLVLDHHLGVEVAGFDVYVAVLMIVVLGLLLLGLLCDILHHLFREDKVRLRQAASGILVVLVRFATLLLSYGQFLLLFLILDREVVQNLLTVLFVLDK